MSLRSKLSSLIIASFLTSSVYAADMETNNNKGGGLFIEPAVTYESGTLKLTYPAPFSSSSETVRGLGIGARIGVHFYDVLFAALDLRYSKPRYESAALSDSADANAYNGGVTVGMQTPLAGLRLWGTYIADGMLDPDVIRGVDLKYTGFNGYRVGGGFYIAMVSVNLEYQEAKYKSNSATLGGFFAPGSLDNVYGTQTGYIVSVSFPFAL